MSLGRKRAIIHNNGNRMTSPHCPEKWRGQNKGLSQKDGWIYFVVGEEESKRHKREGSPTVLQYRIFHFLVSCIDQCPSELLDPRKINVNKNCLIMGTCKLILSKLLQECRNR